MNILGILNNPCRIFLYFLNRSAKLWPDRIFLLIKFRLEMGYWMKFNHPTTFNEKLQWLKLYNRKKEYTQMVDKYAVKEYVGKIIGEEYIIPTLGIWEKPEDIDWGGLPNEFVLKTTHGGGGCDVIICKDKSSFNKEKAIKDIKSSLKSDIYIRYREWPYKNVSKRIIAEKYMSNDGKELEDYKIHNFNGEPKLVLVCKNRFKDSPMIDDFYSTNWELLDLRRPGHPNSEYAQECPKQLEEMLYLSKLLSKGIPFLRTDFYIINERVYFGEITFFPAAGMSKFEPEKWDRILGDWIKLPQPQKFSVQ